ncbi:HAMP domain-containing histidine kinase [Patescibacteria group bacterium]|nr:HAMP domain-containing histidine kinase [Patescibacteria group bacterium]
MKFPHLSIFLQFILLGTIVFIALGVFLSTLIAPALKTFILDQRELDSVVFANRLAADILSPEDFARPAIDEEHIARFERFTTLLQVPGLFRIKIWNPDGTIIYSNEQRLIGVKFQLSEGVIKALSLEASAKIEIFNTNDPHHKYELQFVEGLEVYAPITFGNSAEVIGVIETYSRTGFINQQINKLKTLFTQRVALSLVIMFAVLSFIVWRASRTVDLQGRELSKYASGLEKMVDTRTRELKETTQREIDKANELVKLKDQFVFVAAHELRTPANAIKWGLSAIESKHPEIVKEEKESFDILRNSNERLLFLVQDILNVARIEGKTLQLKLANISAVSAITDAEAEVKSMAAERSVAIENTVKQDTPAIVGDEMRLKEVLVNLLTNAVKYGKAGGVVTISSEVKDDSVIFHVANEGMGISPQHQKHIFEKFWRAKTSQDIEGTGLGLFIVKQLVELMSGEIWFKSKPGEGTIFSFSLKTAGSPAGKKVLEVSLQDKESKASETRKT